jgi:peptidoglycan/LPS O-acetylase OafA/YrhL
MIGKPVGAANAAPTQRAAERWRMSLEVALDLFLCGALTAGLPFLARHLQPEMPRRTVVLGLVGGGLCVLWSVLGRLGLPSRVAAMATLAAVASVCVFQAVQSWQTAAAPGSKGRIVAALMVVMAASCVGTMVSLARDGKDPQS